jgi:hypothetical protein
MSPQPKWRKKVPYHLGTLFSFVVVVASLWSVAQVRTEGMVVWLQGPNTLVMSNAHVRLEYNLSAGTTDFYWENTKKISAFYSGVGLSSGYVKGLSFSNRTYAVISTNEVVVTAVAGGLPAMKQHFILDQADSFLSRLEMVGTGISVNWMGPVVVDTAGGVAIGAYSDPRALFVPFDNDHFIRYNATPINSTNTGYEVAAFYDNVTRAGLVVGSVTHDTWKSGVYWSGSNNKLDKMNVFGGATSASATWDVMPHGWVSGNTISSPTMFVGFGPDWRTMLEAFADANARVVPMLPWTNGVPFGWNSWGYYQTHITYSSAIAVSDSIHTNLQPYHFANNGTVYVNLDSYWDNMTDTQLLAFANHCHANGQKAGIYWSPFVWWGSSVNASNSFVEGTTNTYYYSDVLLRTASSSFQTNDGALAMDISHPGTKQRIDYYFNRFFAAGFNYIKLDFLSHGALEGVHHDPAVMTGMQAYNQGMQYVLTKLNGLMFISESIAPLFPYQFAHARRIACDANNSRIADTSYTMNSVSYGWWLAGRLYNFNDPDIMVFANGADANENQSRLISGAVTGLFLNGDSLTNAASISAAQNCLTNAAIDDVARAGVPFRPVEGNSGNGPEDIFVRQDNSAWYLAVFNYSSSATNRTIDLGRAGVGGTFSPLDCWSGTVLPLTNSFLTIQLNPRQARLFRLRTQPRLLNPHQSPGGFGFTVQGDGNSSFSIQKSVDLARWGNITTLTSSNVQVSFTDTNNVGTNQFYRARLLP